MTGFGEAEQDFDFGRLRVEIRSVNHRYLNVQLRVPSGLERLQASLERTVRDRLSRGHVSIAISLDTRADEDEGVPALDMDRARGYRDVLRRLQAELGVGGSVDVALIAGFRDIFQRPRPSGIPDELDGEIVEAVLVEALDQLVSMREDEGARLAADLSTRLQLMEREIEAVFERAPHRLVEERNRIRDAIHELLDGEAPLDEERIAREVAHMAERWDIHEELVRFRSHLQMFRETMTNGSEDGVGKRFGFISQEMLREVNTIGSKANDAQIAAHVVTLKEEVDRIREQLENVE